jgi:hypothetical protein
VARGRARAAATAARWQTVEPRGGVARAREGQGGEARAVARLGRRVEAKAAGGSAGEELEQR